MLTMLTNVCSESNAIQSVRLTFHAAVDMLLPLVFLVLFVTAFDQAPPQCTISTLSSWSARDHGLIIAKMQTNGPTECCRHCIAPGTVCKSATSVHVFTVLAGANVYTWQCYLQAFPCSELKHKARNRSTLSNEHLLTCT